VSFRLNFLCPNWHRFLYLKVMAENAPVVMLTSLTLLCVCVLCNYFFHQFLVQGHMSSSFWLLFVPQPELNLFIPNACIAPCLLLVCLPSRYKLVFFFRRLEFWFRRMRPEIWAQISPSASRIFSLKAAILVR
jgi:hypothetical protein